MSLIFNGTSDYAFARFATPMINTANAFTIYAMFRTPAVFATDVIYSTTTSSTGANDSGRGYSLGISSAGALRVSSSTSGGIVNSNYIGTLLPNTTYRTILVKTAGSPNPSLYLTNINYVRVATGMAESGSTLLGLVVGKSSSSNGSYFDGQIEDLAIWRSALSTDDINTLFNTARRPTDTTVLPDDYWPLVDSDDSPTAGTYDIVRTGPAIASTTLITAASLAPKTKVLGSSDLTPYNLSQNVGGSGEHVLPAFTAAADASIFRLGITLSSFYSTNAVRLSLRNSNGDLLTTGLIGSAGVGDITVEVPVVNITAGQSYYITVCFQGGLQITAPVYSGGYVVLKETGSTYDIPLANFTIVGRMNGANFSIPHVWAEGSSGTSDILPDTLVFSTSTNNEKNTLVTSNSSNVTGITEGIDIPITVSNGEYSVNGGLWKSTAGTVVLNNSVRLRGLSSTSYNTNTQVDVTIGSVPSSFVINTRAAVTMPTAYSFDDISNVQPSISVESNVITILGIDSDVTPPISITNGEYSINGGVWTNTVGTISLNDNVQVRGISSATLSSSTDVTLNVGSRTDIFTITTVPTLSPAINVVSSSTIVDDISGYTVSTYNLPSATFISVGGRNLPGFSGSNNSYAFNAFTLANGNIHSIYGDNIVLSVDGSANTNVTVQPAVGKGFITLTAVNSAAPFIGSHVTTAIGDQIVYDLPATLSTTTNIVESSGRIVSTYSLAQNFYHISATTGLVTLINIVAPDIIPTDIIFTPAINIAPNDITESNEVTILGTTANQQLDVIIDGGEYAINTGSGFGTWASIPTTVKLNDIVKVRRNAPSTFSASNQISLFVSGVESVFIVNTLIPDDIITTLGIINATDVPLNTIVESNVLTIGGITAGYNVPINVTGGEYAINTGSGFGAFKSTDDVVQLGHQIKLRGTSSIYNNFPKVVIVNIGTISEIFTHTTVAEAIVSLSTSAVNIDNGTNTLTVSNLTNANSLTIGNYNVPSLSGSGITYNFTIPLLIDGILYPKYGTQLLTLSKDSNFGSTFVDIYPDVTKGYITLTSVNNSIGYIGYYLTCAIGDQLIFDLPSTLSVTSNSVGLDGRINTDYRGTQVIYHRRNSDGLITQINLNTQILIDLTSLIKNATKPYIDGLWPLGNR